MPLSFRDGISLIYCSTNRRTDIMEFVISLSMLASFLAAWVIARKWICKAPKIELLTFCLHKIDSVAIQAVLCSMRITGFLDDLSVVR